MTAARFESVGEDAAAKPARNDAQSVEQDETEAYSFPPETSEK
jgi:hypothetical protein